MRGLPRRFSRPLKLLVAWLGIVHSFSQRYEINTITSRFCYMLVHTDLISTPMSADAVACAVTILIGLKVKLSATAASLIRYLCGSRYFSDDEIYVLFEKVYPNISRDILWS